MKKINGYVTSIIKYKQSQRHISTQTVRFVWKFTAEVRGPRLWFELNCQNDTTCTFFFFLLIGHSPIQNKHKFGVQPGLSSCLYESKREKTKVTFSTLVETKETDMAVPYDCIIWCHHKLMVCLVDPHQLLKSDIYKFTTHWPQQIGTWQLHFPIAFRSAVVSDLKLHQPVMWLYYNDVAILQCSKELSLLHGAIKGLAEIFKKNGQNWSIRS